MSRRLELPTWAVVFVIHGAWIALTLGFHALPLWAVVPLAGYVIALHGSLQHEAVHGHPTPWPGVNAAIAGVPLGLWLPFPVYRSTHLMHHDCRDITDPAEDPESYYVDAAAWDAMGRLRRGLYLALGTLLGRLVLGPPVVVVRL